MLTAIAVRNAKPDKRPRKLSDEKGLYLLVQPKGSKYWRMKYRFAGKEKLLALGVYPDVSLSTARERRDNARRLLADEVDPSAVRRQGKLANIQSAESSFENVALEWFAKTWTVG